MGYPMMIAILVMVCVPAMVWYNHPLFKLYDKDEEDNDE